MTTGLAIEDLGSRVATVWSELRPATRGFVERALQAGSGNAQPTRNFHYDARADLELSRFLTALDDRIAEKNEGVDLATTVKVKTVAEACAAVLQEKTESAEVFSQLVRRADSQRDYKRIDALGDALNSRFPPTNFANSRAHRTRLLESWQTKHWRDVQSRYSQRYSAIQSIPKPLELHYDVRLWSTDQKKRGRL